MGYSEWLVIPKTVILILLLLNMLFTPFQQKC